MTTDRPSFDEDTEYEYAQGEHPGHRDQTQPRSAADYLRAQLAQMELKGKRTRSGEVLPAPEVRQAIGQAAGALEALEDAAGRAARLQDQLNEKEAELQEARGDTDPDALRLWRARYMADAQQAAEELYAGAQDRARAIVADARTRGEAMLAEASRRASRTLQTSPDGMPARPELPGDRIEAALVRARYLDSVASWLGDQRQGLRADLDEADRALAEARQLSGS